MLRIGDKVVVLNSYKDTKGRNGRIIDLKWNLIFICFDDTGEHEWIDSRLVRAK